MTDFLQSLAPTHAAAMARVAAVRPSAYARTRNHLDGAVTGLSPWLTHGIVTLPEVLTALLARGDLPADHKLVYEFGWREYFRHVWAHEGEGILRSLHRGLLDDDAYARELPTDIREGHTGVLAIDMAVRTLYATGTLHNHARMWLASYVVHIRKVHWRAGADWMVAHLLDGDLASNHLSWQWVAGTGSHKPYLFNAENVARFAPPEWHSPGTVIDCSYEELDCIARSAGPAGKVAGMARSYADHAAGAGHARDTTNHTVGAGHARDTTSHTAGAGHARDTTSHTVGAGHARDTTSHTVGAGHARDTASGTPTTPTEPAPFHTPPADLTITTPDATTRETLRGRTVWLVHPWALRAPPSELPSDTITLGVYPQEHHATWPWPAARWRWVDAGMSALTAYRWFVTADELAATLADAAEVRSVDDPHITPWLRTCASLDPAPALFPTVPRRCTSFSQWWSRATRGLRKAEELL